MIRLTAKVQPPERLNGKVQAPSPLYAKIQAVKKVEKSANLPDLLTIYQLAKL